MLMKYKRRQQPMKNEIDVAVQWWCRKLEDIAHIHSVRKDAIRMFGIELNRILTKEYRNNWNTLEPEKGFKERMVASDCSTLYDACRLAGVGDSLVIFTQRISMVVNPGYVAVTSGYDRQVLYERHTETIPTIDK